MFGLFSNVRGRPTGRRRSSKARRTSKTVPRRTSKTAAASAPKGMTVRRGLIIYRNVRAEEYKGDQSMFKGRIAVDRGSGMVEFPNPSQFGRIAREEGIAPEHVRRAFGHMRGLKANPGVSGGKKIVRRGLLQMGDHWIAEELPPSADPAVLGETSDKRIMLRVDGVFAGLLDVGAAMQRARAEGFSASDASRAFGHIQATLVPGAKSEAPRRALDQYGPRRMKLGHWDPESGQVKGGVRKGSLVLYDKQSGRTPWAAQVIPPEDRKGNKALLVRYGGKSTDLTFDQALTGVGLRGAHRKELSAAARNIPMLAFLNSFAFLLPKAEAKRFYAAAAE